MARKLLVLIAIMVPLTLAACGDDDETTTAASSETTAAETTAAEETTASGGGGETVAISETEFALDPSDADGGGRLGHLRRQQRRPRPSTTSRSRATASRRSPTDRARRQRRARRSISQPGTYEMYCSDRRPRRPGHGGRGHGRVTPLRAGEGQGPPPRAGFSGAAAPSRRSCARARARPRSRRGRGRARRRPGRRAAARCSLSPSGTSVTGRPSRLKSAVGASIQGRPTVRPWRGATRENGGCRRTPSPIASATCSASVALGGERRGARGASGT